MDKPAGKTVNLYVERNPEDDALADVLRLASQGDVKAFRKIEDEVGDDNARWKRLAMTTHERLVRLIAHITSYDGKNLVYQRGVLADIADRTKELAGPDPSPTESLLALRAALCFQILANREMEVACREDAEPLAWLKYREWRVSVAHSRLMSALKTLATVRKLARPGLTVNLNQTTEVNMPPADPQPSGMAELLSSRGRN